MKLTNEERGHIMMLYPNAEIKVADSTKHYRLAGIVEGKCYVRGSQGVMKIRIADICQLILQPLSEITDADAVEVAKIEGLANAIVTYRDKNGVRLEDDGYRMYIGTGSANYLYMRKDGVDFALATPAAVIDYLRSKSYALPYKNQDLFTLGIATTKSK